MKSRKFLLNEGQRQWVRSWWLAMQPLARPADGDAWGLGQLGRRDRAELRRCTTADDLLAHKATLLLARRLIALGAPEGPLRDDEQSYGSIARMAGVLVTVKVDAQDDRTLARRLSGMANQGRRPFSEIRFRTLHRCVVLEDLLRHWRRAVRQAEGRVDVVRLADDLLCWQRELAIPTIRVSTGVKFHWANDYYLDAPPADPDEQPATDMEKS